MSGTVLDVYRAISRVSLAILLIILFNLTYITSNGISDLRLCGDKNCQKVISIARALARHKQMDPIYLYFERGDDVHILSKSAGKNPDLWGGKVNGKRGYFHKSFVQEYRVQIPNPVHIMPTEDHIPLEEKIMNFNRNQKIVNAPSQNEAKVDNSGGQEKQEVQDSRKEDNNKPDTDALANKVLSDDTEVDETDLGDNDDDADEDFAKAVDNFDRDFEKLDDDTEVSEEDENVDPMDENDTPKFSEQTKTEDKSRVSQLESEQGKQEELKKMLEARHSTSQDEKITDQPAHSVDTQEDKDDTEIDEPDEDVRKSDAESLGQGEEREKDNADIDDTEVKEDNNKKSNTDVEKSNSDLLSQVEERKENNAEVDDTEIKEDDNKKNNTEVKKSDPDLLNRLEERNENKREIDDTEIEEDDDDKQSVMEPVVHDDNGNVLLADDKTKEVIEKETGHIKDIVQSQVEEAIKQTETEREESVKEMRMMERTSDSQGTDTNKTVTKDKSMEAKNMNEIHDLKKEEISVTNNREAVSVNKDEDKKLEQSQDVKNQDMQKDQGESRTEVSQPVVSHEDHDQQSSVPEIKDDISLKLDKEATPSGTDAKSDHKIQEEKDKIPNAVTDSKDTQNLADGSKNLQNGHQAISEQEVTEQEVSDAGSESTKRSKQDQLDSKKDEVINNNQSQEFVDQASEKDTAGQQQTQDDSTGKPQAQQTEDKFSVEEQVGHDGSVTDKFLEGQPEKVLDSVERKPLTEQHLPKDGIEKTEQLQLADSTIEKFKLAQQHISQESKEREPSVDQHIPQNDIKGLPSKSEQSSTQDSTEKKPQTEQQQPLQDITREKPTDEENSFGKNQVIAEAMRQHTPTVVEKTLLPSEPTMSLQTAQSDFIVIDGTPIPLEMIEDTVNMIKPSEKPELKMSITDKAITETTLPPDIQASKTQGREQNTKDVTKDDGREEMHIAQQQSQLVVSSRIQDVHSTIQESLSQHPSFTSSDADSLTSSETASLSETSVLNTGATEDASDKKSLTEKLQQSVSVSEQLESSMGIPVSDEDRGSVNNEPSTQPDKDPELQSEALTKNNTHVKQDETKPPPLLSAKEDIYATTADFISRKTLSHDGHFDRIHKDPGNQEAGHHNGQGHQHQAHPHEPQERNIQKNEATTKPTSFDPQVPPADPGKQDHTGMELPTVLTSDDAQIDGPQGVTPAYEPNIDIPPPPVDKPTAIVHPMGEDSAVSNSAKESSTQTSRLERSSETVGTYETDPVQSRKINDNDLEIKEDRIYLEENTWSKMLDMRLSNLIRKLPPSMQSLLEQEPLGLTPQMTVLVTIVTFMVFLTISCCTLFCGSKKPKKKDPVLVVRALEEQLFIMTKEKENLEDDLLNTQSKMKEMEKSLVTQESSTGELETNLHNYKLHNEVMKTNIATLQQEITDLKKELTDSKKEGQSKHDKISSVQKEVKQKDKKLSSTQEALDKSNKNLAECLAEITSLKSQIQSVTDQVKHLETRKQQLIQETDGWNEKVQDLTERLDQSLTGQKQMQEDLAFKENELEVLRDCFLQLKAFETDETDGQEVDSSSIQEKFKSMMDVSRVNATLKAVEEEKDTTQNKLDIETQCRKDMEEQIASLQAKVETYQADKMKAERQSHEYQTKLNVLSHYFKEKELQLQRELGEQEALKKQNIDRLEHADERSKMVETELQTYKSQAEDLKAEILSAERDFRSQIAANEKKAHENWLAARAAERELKETKHESSVLRQKLTDLERRLLHGPSGLIRPLPTRLGPPPGINGPPPPPHPGMDRPGSRGGAPSIRDDEFRDSPGPDRVPPPGSSHDRRLPPGPMGPGGPRMPLPPMLDGRSPPPYDRRPPPPPMDRRSPPPYDRGLRMPPPMDGLRMPPPPMDRRSPGYRMPPPDMIPRMRGPPPPHGLPNSPPPPPMGMGPPPDRQGLGNPRYRPPPDQEQRPRQQSQV